jgi:hypothetical protein
MRVGTPNPAQSVAKTQKPSQAEKRQQLAKAAYQLGKQLRPALQSVTTAVANADATGQNRDLAAEAALRKLIGPELPAVHADGKTTYGGLFVGKDGNDLGNLNTVDHHNAFTSYVDTDRTGPSEYLVAVDPKTGNVYVGWWAREHEDKLSLFGPLKPNAAANAKGLMTTELETWLQGPIADGVWGEKMRPVP